MHTSALEACVSYEEEDTCVSYEEEDTCVSYEEEDTCVSMQRSALQAGRKRESERERERRVIGERGGKKERRMNASLLSSITAQPPGT
jgi:hypothetical protein